MGKAEDFSVQCGSSFRFGSYLYVAFMISGSACLTTNLCPGDQRSHLFFVCFIFFGGGLVDKKGPWETWVRLAVLTQISHWPVFCGIGIMPSIGSSAKVTEMNRDASGP